MSRGSFTLRSVRRTAAVALLSAPLTLLTACGGGGGGGSAAPAPTPPVASSAVTLAITVANSNPVAADALGTVTGEAAAQAGTSLVTGVQLQQDGAVVATGPASLAATAQHLLARVGRPASLATGVVASNTLACSLGGSLAISGSVSGTAGLAAGDTVTITSNNCVDTSSSGVESLAGSITINVTAGSFNPNSVLFPQHVVLTIAARNFSITSLGVTSSSDGDLTLDLTQTGATAASAVISGSSLTNGLSGPGGSHSTTMRDYRIAQTQQGTQLTNDVTATIESSNSRLGAGTVVYTVSTPQPITTDAALVVRGSLKVTGANSGLLLTVTTVDNYTLQVDTNGDGAFDSSTTTTTADLRALL